MKACLEKQFLKKVMDVSDLLQTYTDIALDRIEEVEVLDPKIRPKLIEALKKYRPKNPDEAGARAIILFILKES